MRVREAARQLSYRFRYLRLTGYEQVALKKLKQYITGLFQLLVSMQGVQSAVSRLRKVESMIRLCSLRYFKIIISTSPMYA